MRSLKGCVFCEKATTMEGCIKHDFVVVSFEPLNPVVAGHRLFIPVDHVVDAADDPHTTAQVMFYAAWWIKDHFAAANLITSVGAPASQTVMHYHVHVVPRFENDGLKLPWTDQEGTG